MKILIVEDDFTSRYGIEMILQEYGECHTAVDGEEAVNIFKEAVNLNLNFNVIFLDIMLPKKNGQEVLKEIREIEERNNIFEFEDRCKVIMLTALNDYSNIKSAFNSICDSYLFKPIEKEKIIKELQRLNLI